MLIRFQPYDIDVIYKPGRDIPVADALSQSAIPGKEIPGMDIIVHEVTHVSQSRLDQVQAAMEVDPTLILLKKAIHTGWPSSQGQCPDKTQDYYTYCD